jgi:spore coat polysaccharide biosynthesis protein SpsF
VPNRSSNEPSQPAARRHSPPRLVLGTVQLGLAYGIANRSGLPSEAAAVELIGRAVAAGISCLDTARAYGEAERRIGLALPEGAPATVVTKLDPLKDALPETPSERVVAAARASLERSLAALRRHRLDAVLLHRARHRTEWAGAVWRLLLAERDAGRIGWLGVSVQSPEEALEALSDPEVAHVQLPFNLLDRRWASAAIRAAVGSRPDVSIHARSALLQGLLTCAPELRWPAIHGLDPAALCRRLRELAARLGRIDPVDLCLAFVRAQSWIDGVVVGMETVEQLGANVALFDRPPLGGEETAMVMAALPTVPDALLDPAQWPPPAR